MQSTPVWSVLGTFTFTAWLLLLSCLTFVVLYMLITPKHSWTVPLLKLFRSFMPSIRHLILLVTECSQTVFNLTRQKHNSFGFELGIDSPSMSTKHCNLFSIISLFIFSPWSWYHSWLWVDFFWAHPLHNFHTCSAATLVHAFICSRLDHEGSLYSCLPVVLLNLLQSLLCYAARLLVGTKRHDHISDHMTTTLYGIGFLTQHALNSTFCQQLRELHLTPLATISTELYHWLT